MDLLHYTMLSRPLTADNIITIGNHTVLVKPKISARWMILRYNLKKGLFTLSTPKRVNKKLVSEFLSVSEDWMRQQIEKTPAPVSLTKDGLIILEGIKRNIIHHDGTGVHVELSGATLHITCRASRLDRAVQRFVQQHASDLITRIAYEKAAAIGKKIKKITLRDTTSRWGSCSHDGSLSFSWRLIMAPMATIDYVVAHEVAHLQHFDHSPAFWALCRDLSMDYTKGKHWLKLNGRDLHAVVL